MTRWLRHPAAQDFLAELRERQLSALEHLLEADVSDETIIAAVRLAQGENHIVGYVEARIEIAKEKEVKE